jgi:putative endonuclease
MKPWHVYIVHCADGSLYTGITTDVERRIDEHNHDDRLAARYTRGRRPVKLIYSEEYASRSEASKRESEIKQMERPEKEALVENPEINAER